MKDKVISKTITLFSPEGQCVYFQMHLPRDVKRVIGVETSILFEDVYGSEPTNRTTAPYFKGKNAIGLLSLRLAESSQHFYSDYLWDKDVNQKDWDFSLNSNVWDYNLWSLAAHRQETPLDITGESMFIEGYYADIFNVTENIDFTYHVTIHIWYSTE